MNIRDDQIIVQLKEELLLKTIEDEDFSTGRFKHKDVVLRNGDAELEDLNPLAGEEEFSKATIQNLTARGLEVIDLRRIMYCIIDRSGNWSIVSLNFMIEKHKYRACPVRTVCLIPFKNILAAKYISNDPQVPGFHIWCKPYNDPKSYKNNQYYACLKHGDGDIYIPLNPKYQFWYEPMNNDPTLTVSTLIDQYRKS